jgi:purine-binding chemotaxis protein CheW
MARTNISDNNASVDRILIVSIGEHFFGAKIDIIHDVIRRQKTTPVPLASPNIVGLLNLRGHIVTEINMAKTLDLDHQTDMDITKQYSMVINRKGELYSLTFDAIGDVIDVPKGQIERLPETINPRWFDMSEGVYRMDDKLIVVLDLYAIIDQITADVQVAV